MQRKLITSAMVVVAIVITATTVWAAGQTSNHATRQAWQHLAMDQLVGNSVSDPEFARRINKLGDEGWELVTVMPVTEDGTTKRASFYFKRPK